MELTLSVHDRLRLYTRTFLAPHHEQVVSLLYQPIIGMNAVNLYLTLWRFLQIEKNALFMSHNQLLTFFDYDLEEFEKVRHRLEGIDLLHVYYHHQEGYYLYELRQPLTSQQFFQDSNLNVYLLYKVGYNLYEYLEKKFIVPNGKKGMSNRTKSFSEVYGDMDYVSKMDDCDVHYVVNSGSSIKAPLRYSFDYETFLMLLNKSFISKELIDPEVKERIINEAALYGFDAEMMSKIVLDTVENGELDLDKLHQKAREYYRRLGTKREREELKPQMTLEQFNAQQIDRYESDERRKIALRNYKTKTPNDWLYVLLNYVEPPARFLDVIYVLQSDYRLPVEVINVLVEYVLDRTDGRLPMEYCKAIASSWSYKKIKTAEQAMEEIDKIIHVEESYKEKGKTPPTYVRRKRGYVASEPDWLETHEEYRKQAKDEEVEVDVQALQALLSSFK